MSKNASFKTLQKWKLSFGKPPFMIKGRKIWNRNMLTWCLYLLPLLEGHLYSRDTYLGSRGFPWIEVVLCAFLTERIPRMPLNVEVLLYALLIGRINLFPRQTIEEPRSTGVTVPSSQKCFHGIIENSSKPTGVVRRSKPCEVVAFGAKNRAFIWYRAGQ